MMDTESAMDTNNTKPLSNISYPPKTIQELIHGLTELTKNDKTSKDTLRVEITDFLKSYKGDDWQKYRMFDDHKYARNRIHLDPNHKFELLLLGWNISSITPVHNHPDSQCFFMLMEGSLLCRNFDKPINPNKRAKLVCTGEELVDKIGGVGYIDDGMGLHLVENLSPTEKCCTMHLYTPSYKNVTCWDERTGQKTSHSCENYSVGGVKLNVVSGHCSSTANEENEDEDVNELQVGQNCSEIVPPIVLFLILVFLLSNHDKQ